MKILMISSLFPYPPTKGRIQLRTFYLLKYLGQRHNVTFVTQHTEEITEIEINSLKEWVEDLKIFSSPETLSDGKGLLKRITKPGIPSEFLTTYSEEMQDWITNQVKEKNFDLITCEHSMNEIYVRTQWQNLIPSVINIHRSIYRTFQQDIKSKTSEGGIKDQLNLPLLKRYEQQYSGKFASIVTMTKEDRRILKEMNPEAKITVIPNGVDLSLFPKRPNNQGGQRIIFMGAMDNPANIDAVRFFSLEVFPEILKRYPEAQLEIVGTRPVAEVVELNENPGITVIGEVKSMVEYLHWATVCVIPMRKGSGMKNKTLEAMAAGVPVVANDLGLDSLPVDGADVPLRAMRANTVNEYIYAIGRLFEEPKLREKLAENGRSLVEKEYTWEKVGQSYEQVLNSTVNQDINNESS